MMIGELNKRILLQYTTSVVDAMGGSDDIWNDKATVWAAIWPVSAAEQVRAGQTFGTVTHKIRIRYRSDIRNSWRIKFGERYFTILGPPINPNEKNEWLDLITKEVI